MACCCSVVSTGELGAIERFGKFEKFASPGINFVFWPVSSLAKKLSMRLQQLDVECETKTKDNVFVNVVVSVQFQVLREKAYEAFYRLTNSHAQIRAYIFDVVRSTVPLMDLDQAFESKDEISTQIKSQLTQAMNEYGYMIAKALVTDISPDNRVRAAMNEINANKRLKEAAIEKAEADKILMVKAAEAQAESQYLSGVGVAKQRRAIVDGMRESVGDFSSKVSGTSSKQVINLLMVTQYFDMLDAIGSKSQRTSMFVGHSPQNVLDLQTNLRDGLAMKK